MGEYPDSAMIAFIPTNSDWCKVDLPHMTLVYAGEIASQPQGAFNELAKDAAMIAMFTRPFTLKVAGVEIFGDEEKVYVLKMVPSPELLAMRRAVKDWNASQYTDYKPHCTIGASPAYLTDPPMYLSFDRILCCWGDEDLTFNLQR